MEANMELKLFLIFFAGLTAVKAWQITDEGTKECLAEFLKNKSLIETSFPSESCNKSRFEQDIIKTSSDEFMIHAKKYLNSGENEDNGFTEFQSSETCVLKNIKKLNFLHLYLKGITFHAYNKTESDNFDEAVVNDRKFIIDLLLQLCENDHFEKNFEKLSSETTVTAEGECKKKYLIENDFIDLKTWNISMNITDASNCEQVAHDLEVSLDMEINENTTIFGIKIPLASYCAYQKLSKLKINQKKKAIEVLKSVELYFSDEKKLIKMFMSLQSKVAEITVECINLALTVASP
jgi:hypothetical protein